MEEELDCEYKKFECRAMEDSSRIKELNNIIKNYQNELCCAKKNLNMAITDANNKLLQEKEMVII